MKRWMPFVVAGVVGAWLMVFFASTLSDLWNKARQRYQQACLVLRPQTVHPLLGKKAPDFTLSTLQGLPVHLADLRGKTVLVNVWATWCPPCVSEMPALEKLQQSLPNDVVILALNEDESLQSMKSFFPQGTSLRVLHDPNHTVAMQYGSVRYPESFLIDPQGIVRLFVASDPGSWNTEEAKVCIKSGIVK